MYKLLRISLTLLCNRGTPTEKITMIYTINTECIPADITPSQFFLLLSLMEEPNTIETATDLYQKGIVEPIFDSKTRVLRGFKFQSGWRDKVKDILEESVVKKSRDYKELATQLKAIYPSGKKEGTSRYWAEGVALIERRLKLFEKKYGVFPPEEILDAAKRYVEGFDGNYRFMRTLRYFIFREELGVAGEVESKSDLLTYMENKGEDQQQNYDWTTTLV